MTEEEAKKKICPILAIVGIIAAGQGSLDAGKMASCIASDCMMWRCSPKKTDVSGTPIYSTDGCCGLGGKP